MRCILPVLLATVSLSFAELVPFHVENGLSPVPPAAGSGLDPSTGSGDRIESGIWFDTETLTLTFVLGYGSAAGFTDLTGPATAAHIHGPSGGVDTAVLINLAPQHFPNTDPARGGLFRGSAVYDVGLTNDLFLGRQYINVHTAVFPGGEISGFLQVEANEAPNLNCPGGAEIECTSSEGTDVELSVTVSDSDGDGVRVIWTVDGAAYQTNDIPAGVPGVVSEVKLVTTLALGEHTVSVAASDESGTNSCEFNVVIEDTTAPVIRHFSSSPRVLWPPNHKLVPVRLRVEVMDCSEVTWKVVSVTSNEPENGLGDGNTSPDWVIRGDHRVSLRAERSGRNKADRIYTLTIEATDAGGLVSQRTLDIRVPHNMGKGFGW